MFTNSLRRISLIRLFVMLGIMLGAVSSASADIEKVNSLLRRAEANLQSVTASIGNRTTPPRGSAAKLAASRLEQVINDLTPARELLETIPAGTEGRDEAAARYTAAANEYNRLRTILTGSDAPSDASQAEQGTALNYQQEELLKNALFHLNEVERNATQLTEAVERLREVEDQLSIDHREVSQLRDIVENAQRKSGFAKDALDGLPADGRGVAAAKQRKAALDAKVVLAADYLNPLHDRLQELIDPSKYPEFEADRKRLSELSRMYADENWLQTDRSFAAAALNEAEAAKAECIRIAQKYSRLMQQRTPQGVTIESVGNGFLKNHSAFLAAAEAEGKTLPESIRTDLAQAREYAAEAVAEQKPLWFSGGIPQVMGFADDKLMLLEAIDPEAAEILKDEIKQTRKQIQKQADSLRELIIRENRMPEDRFAGEDRDKAIETAKSAWTVQQEEFKLLAVRIPSEQWKRETKWSYSNGTWYFTDKSRLQVRLIVADHENPELAIDRPINVWKDHQAGDSMYGTPLWSFKDELRPNDYLLRANVE